MACEGLCLDPLLCFELTSERESFIQTTRATIEYLLNR